MIEYKQILEMSDIEKGIIDIYVDEIGLSSEQLEYLQSKGIARLSQINRLNTRNQTISSKAESEKLRLSSILSRLTGKKSRSLFINVPNITQKIIQALGVDYKTVIDTLEFSERELEILNILVVRGILLKFSEREQTMKQKLGSLYHETSYMDDVNGFFIARDAANNYFSQKKESLIKKSSQQTQPE